MSIINVGVMCGSSEGCQRKYLEAAHRVGMTLAEHKRTVIYGGGNMGSMKRVADGALINDGRVIGIMPEFMRKVEWHHLGLTELIETKTMSERKNKMLEFSDAFIFLPGGSGTLEEFFEFFTAKRLGFFTGPLVIVNQEGYFSHLIEMLDRMFESNFLNPQHRDIYSVCEDIETLIDVLENAPSWSEDAIKYAGVHS